jgi:hypothetical protein
VSKDMRLNTSISDGNRIFFQFSPPSALLNTSILCMLYSSQCPLHFSKEVLDWCKLNVNTLEALVRNFLPVNNFATWSLVLQRFLLPCFFFFESSLISLHSYPFQWIWVKWYWTWSQEKKTQRSKNLCSTRDQGSHVARQ